jgi:hypothetical protein
VAKLPGGGSSTAFPGDKNAKPQSGGTAFGLVTAAKGLGVGSGGTYATGGGHSGIAKPGTKFDCSGYIYQVFVQNGFKDFPGTSETQWFTDAGTNWTSDTINPSDAKPGDVVFMVGKSYASPGHVGIVTGGSGMGATVMQYYSPGMPPDTILLSNIGDLVGIKRFYLIAQTKTPYGPDLTKTAGSASSAAATKPKKTPWVGATQATIISAQGGIAATLKGLPATLDPVEKNAVAHIEAIQDSLHIHMTPAALAQDKVELTKWGKVLNTEITANAKVVAAAAAAAKQVFDRALSLDVSTILRNFDQNYAAQVKTFNTETSRNLKDMQTAFSLQQAAFDKVTQTGLQGFVVAQTPEEKALADFIAGRAATVATAAAVQRTTDLATQQAALSTMQQVGLGGTDATGTIVTQAMIDTAVAAVATAQDAINQASLDSQQQGLQDAADASRVAQDAQTTAQQQAYQDSRDLQKQALQDKETDLEQAYQDQRDAQAQALQNINDDQKVALQQHLDDLGLSLTNHLITWQNYLDALAKLGVDTTGLVNPVTGQVGGSASTYDKIVSGVLRTAPFGTNIAAAAGGKIPGQYVGRNDTIMARVTPGETVLDRKLTAALEDMVANGGGGPSHVVTIVKVNDRVIAQAIGPAMTAEQARQIGYTIQRG